MAIQMKRITVQTDYELVYEVKATFDADEANRLLQTKKWALLHGCVAHRDGLGYQAQACWLLGRIKS